MADTREADPRKRWIGIFNHSTTDRKVTLTKQDFGFITVEASYNLTATGVGFFMFLMH